MHTINRRALDDDWGSNPIGKNLTAEDHSSVGELGDSATEVKAKNYTFIGKDREGKEGPMGEPLAKHAMMPSDVI